MTVREILLWLSNKDDSIDYDDVKRQLRLAFAREGDVPRIQVGVEAVQQAIFNQRVAARIEEATKWAIWRNGVEVIGMQEHPLKQYIEEIICEEKR